MILDDKDEKILSILILNGPLTTNRLQRESNIPKATFQRHRDYLLAEGLMNRRDIPPTSPKKDSRRSFYARELSITELGVKTVVKRKTEKIEALKAFLENEDVRTFIDAELFDTWVKEAIEDNAAREAEEEYHNRP